MYVTIAMHSPSGLTLKHVVLHEHVPVIKAGHPVCIFRLLLLLYFRIDLFFYVCLHVYAAL